MKHLSTISSAALAIGTMLAPFSVSAEESNPLQFDFGNDGSLTFYGYLKATYISDFDYDLGDTTKGLKSIGLPGGSPAGSHERLHLKESRIGLNFRSSDVLVKLEGDFFGTKNDLNLRTRLAYVTWNGALIGQDWTNFMSVENLGRNVDFQGPAGLPFARLPQIKYTFGTPQNWSVSASIEEDVSNDSDHHYTVAARKGFDGGMFRVAGLYRDTVLGGTPVQGWGLSLGGTLNAWEGGKVSGLLTTGEGISDILAFGLSGNAISVGGDEVGVVGFSLGVSQKVSEKITLAAFTGYTNLDVATGTDTKQLRTLHMSAFYDVAKNVELGLEYYIGRRKQGDGVSFEADRLLMSAKFTF
ncbi:hypothetical protein SAMN05444000_104176 [Shimia gijangensis]|uniref:Porin n=1 Tax=Shimia gijangensis TaxID=1470563 RepID=A0A1M6FVM6_9RHOB|nr:hypothetical protein [Shimia gijangensis]SHJ01702.1 hypothetical protein SAMN05444000_104176 [Shimia gijangensis]